MMRKYEYAWYFEISKEAEMANDGDGNPSECYSCITLGFDDPKSTEEVKELEPKVASMVSNAAEIPLEWVTVITKEKYDLETEEDEDHE